MVTRSFADEYLLVRVFASGEEVACVRPDRSRRAGCRSRI